MNDNSNIEDAHLSQLYHSLNEDQPSAACDKTILNAAEKSCSGKQRTYKPQWAIAASIMLLIPVLWLSDLPSFLSSQSPNPGSTTISQTGQLEDASRAPAALNSKVDHAYETAEELLTRIESMKNEPQKHVQLSTLVFDFIQRYPNHPKTAEIEELATTLETADTSQ